MQKSRSYTKLIFGAVLLSIFNPFSSNVFSQVNVSSPAADTTIASCDEYSTSTLHDPWDMDKPQDINNYFAGVDVSGLSNGSFASGVFSALTTTAASTMYLVSPQPCGSFPVGGRWGQTNTINTAKYDTLSIKMALDQFDSQGFRLIWDRSCDYASTRTVTLPTATNVGWNTYTMNLNNASIDGGSSSTAAWSAQPVTGLALLPTLIANSNVAIDWIRLEDSSSCGSSTVSSSATASGNNGLYSVWIDSDNNPFNGFEKSLVKAGAANSANTDSTVSSLGLFPGEYKIVSLLDSDYRTLEQTDPWDMNQSSDILNFSTESSSFANGKFSGVASANQNIFLKLTDGGIDTSKYSKLSLGLARSTGTAISRVIWTNNSGASGFIDFRASDDLGGGLFQFDLAGAAGWSGTIESIIIQPSLNEQLNFALDFVSIRNSGFESSRDSNTIAAQVTEATAKLKVNAPPVMKISEPDIKGGEAIRPWNMNEGDTVIYGNLLDGDDASAPGEKYVSYLPDVRLIDGVRGDFFKGTNDPEVEDSDDAVNYSMFPFRSDSFTFNSAEYHNLCFKLLIGRAFDLGLGSVARVIWKSEGENFKNTEDLPLISDNWSGNAWYEYCMDMDEVLLENSASSGWTGNIEAFRVDAHEFRLKTSYYFDYIKVRKDDTTNTGMYSIVYNVTDPDSDADINFYYNTTKSTSGGTLIGTAKESDKTNVYKWDTSALANGKYYVYAIANDGLNQTTLLAKGKVIVANGVGAAKQPPVLKVNAPAEGSTVCSALPVSGYSLYTDRFETVPNIEVFVNDNLLGTIDEDDFVYSAEAKATHPTVDSSNSGFSASYNIGGLGNGAHVIKIVAHSVDGTSTTNTINVTKGTTNCSELPDTGSPSGAPVAVSLEGQSGGEETPNPEPVVPTPVPTQVPAVPTQAPTTPTLPSSTAPILSKASLSKKGLLKLVLNNLTEGEAECNYAVYAGLDAASLTLAKSLAATKAKLTLQAKKVKIPKKTVSSFVVQVVKTCQGFVDSFSEQATVKVRTKKGKLTTTEQIVQKLGRLKVLKKKRKKRKK